MKKGRVTASMCKACCGAGSPNAKVKRIITVGSPTAEPCSVHMQYGLENEDKACEMFASQMEAVHIRKCGLFVCAEHGQLAASPDRVGEIAGERVVVEVKCLSGSRTMSPSEAVAQRQSKSDFAFRMVNKKISLKERHTYFYQVQMQMGITGIHTAYVVVFTHEGVPVEWTKVMFDTGFWNKKKEKLLDFHSQYVVPALVAQRFG